MCEQCMDELEELLDTLGERHSTENHVGELKALRARIREEIAEVSKKEEETCEDEDESDSDDDEEDL